jgi:hypothetical protein
VVTIWLGWRRKKRQQKALVLCNPWLPDQGSNLGPAD